MAIEQGIDRSKMAPIDTQIEEPSDIVKGVEIARRLREVTGYPTGKELVQAFKQAVGVRGRDRLPVIGQASDLASARLDVIQNGTAKPVGNGKA